MSYILEALRRAETERERKRRVPGLHAQPVPVLPAEEQRAPPSRMWMWIALGLGAAMLVAGLWRCTSGDAAGDEPMAARGAATGSVTPNARAPAEPLPPPPAAALTTTEPAAPVAAAAAAPEHPPTAPHKAATVAAKPSPKLEPHGSPAAPTEPPAARPGPVGAAKTAVSGATPRATPAAATGPAAAPEPRLRSLAELPADIRASVPPLAFGGSVYSEVAAQRMVILNGQVMREGDAIGDDLVVEQIRPRSAVLLVRGQRFEMPF